MHVVCKNGDHFVFAEYATFGDLFHKELWGHEWKTHRSAQAAHVGFPASSAAAAAVAFSDSIAANSMHGTPHAAIGCGAADIFVPIGLPFPPANSC
jgi:hypothetical protein